MNTRIKKIIKAIPGSVACYIFISRLFVKFLRLIGGFIGRHYISKKKNFRPMVIVAVSGGLGDQMRHFILGCIISKVTGMPVKYDMGWYKTCGKDSTGKNSRNFDLLNAFDVPFDVATHDEIMFYKTYFFRDIAYRAMEEDDENVIGKTARYLACACATPQMMLPFRHEILSMFVFRQEGNCAPSDAEILREINDSESVAVHVRRGDFVNTDRDVCSPEYFTQAIGIVAKKLYPKKAKFFVFSNDPAYSRNLFEFLGHDFVFIDHNDNDNGMNDMFLMSKCKHFITSNSGFSWWAAYLSTYDEKIILMPSRWDTAGQIDMKYAKFGGAELI